MSDPIYDAYLIPGDIRSALLQELRKRARAVGLDKHGDIYIRPAGSSKSDSIENYADLHAQRMAAKPALHQQLHDEARVGSLADTDLGYFLAADKNARGLVGKRVSDVISGKLPVMHGKAQRNRKQERRLGIENFHDAGQEINLIKGQKSLALKHKTTVPIDLSKKLRAVTDQEIRFLLDRRNCEGVTALEILTIVTFAQHARKLHRTLSPARRSNMREKRFKKIQTPLL